MLDVTVGGEQISGLTDCRFVGEVFVSVFRSYKSNTIWIARIRDSECDKKILWAKSDSGFIICNKCFLLLGYHLHDPDFYRAFPW